MIVRSKKNCKTRFEWLGLSFRASLFTPIMISKKITPAAINSFVFIKLLGPYIYDFVKIGSM